MVPHARTAHSTGTENAGKAEIAACRLVRRRGVARGLFVLNSLVNFLAVHSHILGCVDPDPDLVSLYSRTVIVISLPIMTVSPARLVRISILPTPAWRGSSPVLMYAWSSLNYWNTSRFWLWMPVFRRFGAPRGAGWRVSRGGRQPSPGRISGPHPASTGRCRPPAQVRPAAALAAHLLGDGLDQVAGTNAVRVVPGHAGGEADLAVVNGPEHDHALCSLSLKRSTASRSVFASAPSMRVVRTLMPPISSIASE